MPLRLKATARRRTLKTPPKPTGGHYQARIEPGAVVPAMFEGHIPEATRGDYEDATADEVKAASSSLPQDYPRRDLLAPHFASHAAVAAAADADIENLDGMGPVGLKEVRAYKPKK